MSATHLHEQKARIWVDPYDRDGRRVDGYWRDVEIEDLGTLVRPELYAWAQKQRELPGNGPRATRDYEPKGRWKTVEARAMTPGFLYRFPEQPYEYDYKLKKDVPPGRFVNEEDMTVNNDGSITVTGYQKEWNLRPDEPVRRFVVSFGWKDVLISQAKKQGYNSVENYQIAQRSKLGWLTTGADGGGRARVSVRVSKDSIPKILEAGRLLNIHDDTAENVAGESGGLSAAKGERTRDEVVAGLRKERDEFERRIWNIPKGASADAHPIYGYVGTDAEYVAGSTVAAFGDTKVVLKDQVRPRTTITYGDSYGVFTGTIGTPEFPVVPSPINDPSELSIGPLWSLRPVSTVVDEFNPSVAPKFPPKILRQVQNLVMEQYGGKYAKPLDKKLVREMSDAELWDEFERLRYLKDDEIETLPGTRRYSAERARSVIQSNAGKIEAEIEQGGWSRWRHGMFTEAQILGGVRLEDIDHIEFPSEPDDETKQRLADAGIPWKTYPPKLGNDDLRGTVRYWASAPIVESKALSSLGAPRVWVEPYVQADGPVVGHWREGGHTVEGETYWLDTPYVPSRLPDAFHDIVGSRTYTDSEGNYRYRLADGKPGGPVTPWSDEARMAFPNHLDLVNAAREYIRPVTLPDPTGIKGRVWVEPYVREGSEGVGGYWRDGAEIDLPKATSWHITDNPKFAFDPERVGQVNSTIGGEMKEPGLFVTQNPEFWVNGHDYIRPFIAEIEHPDSIDRGYYENADQYLPAREYGNSAVKRLIPIDEWVRETYHAPGWIEDYHDDLEGKIRRGEAPRIPADYRYEGPDVRDMTPEQVQWHMKRAAEYIEGSDRRWSMLRTYDDAGEFAEDEQGNPVFDKWQWSYDENGNPVSDNAVKRVWVDPYTQADGPVSGYWREGDPKIAAFVKAIRDRTDIILDTGPSPDKQSMSQRVIPGDDVSSDVAEFWFQPKTKQSFISSEKEAFWRRRTISEVVKHRYDGDRDAFATAVAQEIVARTERAAEVGYTGPTPPVDWQMLVTANRMLEWSAGLDGPEYHPDPTQYKRIAAQHLRTLMADAKVSTRINAEALAKVLDDGRFKNQLEKGVRPPELGAVYAPNDRRRIEREVFGLVKTKASLHPFYGYAGTDDEPNETINASLWVSGYGQIRVVFNDEVKKRTSVTYGDMMYNTDRRAVIPAPFEAMDWQSFGRGFQGNKDTPFMSSVDGLRAMGSKTHFYFDAQIHGGVSVKDIERIEISQGSKMPEGLQAKLDEAGIPVVIKEARGEVPERRRTREVMESYGAVLPPEPVSLDKPAVLRPGQPVAAFASAKGRTWVEPYVREEGEHVEGYWRDGGDGVPGYWRDIARLQMEGQKVGNVINKGSVDQLVSLYRSEPENADEINAALARGFRDAEVRVRVPSGRILDILVARKVMNQHESGLSEAAFDPTRRIQLERTFFNIPEQEFSFPEGTYYLAPNSEWGEIVKNGISGSGLTSAPEYKVLEFDEHPQGIGVWHVGVDPATLSEDPGEDTSMADFVSSTAIPPSKLSYIGSFYDSEFHPDEPQTAPDDHPIYGYVVDSPDSEDSRGTEQYGSIVMRMKKTVAGRSTWTSDDSLNSFSIGGQPERMMGSPIVAPQWWSLDSKAAGWPYEGQHALTPGKVAGDGHYVEAQIHGGVTLDDVEEFVLPADADEYLISHFADAGLPYRVGKHGSSWQDKSSKSRVWVEPYVRESVHVEGYWHEFSGRDYYEDRAKAITTLTEKLNDDADFNALPSSVLIIRGDERDKWFVNDVPGSPTGDVADRVAALLDGFANGPRSPQTLAIKKATADEFGTPLADVLVRLYERESRNPYGFQAMPARTPEEGYGGFMGHPGMRSFVRALYEAAQDDLAKHGVTSMRLYRGDPMITEDGEREMKLNAASSMTTTEKSAEDYARGLSNEAFWRNEAPFGRVVEVTVPAKDVLSLPWVGLGESASQEVVLIGGTYNGNARTVGTVTKPTGRWDDPHMLAHMDEPDEEEEWDDEDDWDEDDEKSVKGRVWVPPYTRRDGVSVNGFWRNARSGEKPTEIVDWKPAGVERTREILGDSLVEMSDSDIVQRHLDELSLLPEGLLERLKDASVTFKIGDGPLPSFPGYEWMAKMRPRGWHEGATWTNVAGGYHPSNRDVIAGYGQAGGKGLILHETGHAVGEAMNFYKSKKLSSFHKRLEPFLMNYFLQRGAAGKQELLAGAIEGHVVEKTGYKTYPQELPRPKGSTIANPWSVNKPEFQALYSEFTDWLDSEVLGLPSTKGSHSSYSTLPGSTSAIPSPINPSSLSARMGTSRLPLGSFSGINIPESVGDEKSQVWVSPYNRDGEQVDGYWKEIPDDVAEWAQASFDHVASLLPDSLKQHIDVRVLPDDDFKLKMEQHGRQMDPTTRGAYLMGSQEILMPVSAVKRFRDDPMAVMANNERAYMDIVVGHEWGHVAHARAAGYGVDAEEKKRAEFAALKAFGQIRYWLAEYARTDPEEAFAHAFSYHILGNRSFGKAGETFDKILNDPRTPEELSAQNMYTGLINILESGISSLPREEFMDMLHTNMEKDFGPNWRDLLADAKPGKGVKGRVWVQPYWRPDGRVAGYWRDADFAKGDIGGAIRALGAGESVSVGSGVKVERLEDYKGEQFYVVHAKPYGKRARSADEAVAIATDKIEEKKRAKANHAALKDKPIHEARDGNEAIDILRGHWPDAQFELDSLDNMFKRDVATVIDRAMEDFPEIRKNLKGVSVMPLEGGRIKGSESSSMADVFARHQWGTIQLNSLWWEDGSGYSDEFRRRWEELDDPHGTTLTEALAQGKENGWSTVTTPAGIVAHELAHTLYDAIENTPNLRRSLAKLNLPEMGASYADGQANEKVQKEERFAEAFGEMRTLPSSEWSDAARVLGNWIQENL